MTVSDLHRDSHYFMFKTGFSYTVLVPLVSLLQAVSPLTIFCGITSWINIGSFYIPVVLAEHGWVVGLFLTMTVPKITGVSIADVDVGGPYMLRSWAFLSPFPTSSR